MSGRREVDAEVTSDKCNLQAQIDTRNYQIDRAGNWIATNPNCVSNCTETMSMDYVYGSSRLNLANDSIYGWIDLSTFQVSSSGFVGLFRSPDRSGLFANSGEIGPLPTVLSIYDCRHSDDCQNAYPGMYQGGKVANSTTTKVVQVPESDPEWEFLLILAVAGAVALLVKHRSVELRTT